MKKDIKFSTRMASADREKIRALAQKAGMSMSDYVTACCLGKRIVILDGLKEVLRQQKAIGNNLNQLTVLANMGKVQFANLDTAAQEFARINTALRELQEGVDLGERLHSRIQIGELHFAHVRQHRQLVEIVADGFLLPQDVLQAVHDDDALSETAGGLIVALRHVRLCRFSAYRF